MEPHHAPTPKPDSHPPRWYEYVIHWSGWETAYEHRRRVALVVALCLLCAGFIGWLFVRRASASVYSTVRAEMIVDRLTQGNEPEKEEVDAVQETKRLEALAPLHSELGSRFSGVIAQEEVLNGSTIDCNRFHVAAQELTRSNLPLQALVVKATQLCAENKPQEALQVIDQILDKGKKCKELYTYALLQKATLLRTMNQPNDKVITEIKEIIANSPTISASIEEWCDDNPEQLLDFLHKQA